MNRTITDLLPPGIVDFRTGEPCNPAHEHATHQLFVYDNKVLQAKSPLGLIGKMVAKDGYLYMVVYEMELASWKLVEMLAEDLKASYRERGHAHNSIFYAEYTGIQSKEYMQIFHNSDASQVGNYKVQIANRDFVCVTIKGDTQHIDREITIYNWTLFALLVVVLFATVLMICVLVSKK
jgi:hypothetical protein